MKRRTTLDDMARAAQQGETREVDPKTGGEKGSKLARFDLIPWDALTALAEHFGRGAEKYADRNWQRGYRYGLSFAAMQRHAAAWWGGEDNDPETGSSHMIAVAWHAIVLWWFHANHVGTDDRYVAGRQAAADHVVEAVRHFGQPSAWGEVGDEVGERHYTGGPKHMDVS